MANLIECYMMNQPVTQFSGSGGPTHTASFHVETDEPLVGDHVIWLAQDGPGAGFPIGSTRVPKLGDRLLWGDGTIVPDTGQSMAAHAASYPTGYGDGGAYALDFECTQKPGSGQHKSHTVTVTWRQPNSTGQELPLQLAPYLGVGISPSGIVPTESTPWTTPSAPEVVAKSGREHWVEYRTEEFYRSGAYRVTGGVPSGVLIRMNMPNGEPYSPLLDTRLKAVQVIATNVPDPGIAIDQNSRFQGTINNDAYGLGSFAVAPYRSTFESARTGRPIIYKNTEMYRMEMRIELHYEAPFIDREAYGTYAINGPLKKVAIDEEGFPVNRIPLDNAGAEANTAHVDTYSLKKPVPYATAFQF